MNLEEPWKKIVELAREELHIVRKRAEEKTPARDHGHDYTRHRPPPIAWIITRTRFVASRCRIPSRAAARKRGR